MNRPDWDTYFMEIARTVATRATCDRKHVGCVIVTTDHAIVATGYNGSLPNQPHCDEAGHLMEHNHCVRTAHAELNAVAQAARRGVSLSGCVVYVTASPCWSCFRILVQAGIVKVVVGEFYRDERTLVMAKATGVSVTVLTKPGQLGVAYCEEGTTK